MICFLYVLNCLKASVHLAYYNFHKKTLTENYCLFPEKSTRILDKLEHTPACTASHTGIVCKMSHKIFMHNISFRLCLPTIPHSEVRFQPISTTILFLILNIPVILMSSSIMIKIKVKSKDYFKRC